MTRFHQVHLGPFPPWLDLDRFLGVPHERVIRADGDCEARMRLDTRQAADLAARARGLAPGGRLLQLGSQPPLPRAAVRGARTEDARRRRATTPGFVQRAAHADAEGRRYLTPERLAIAMAEQARGLRVVDASCGAGGNAIAFARCGCAVTAIEVDAGRLSQARQNAVLYGVADRIRFVHADACIRLPEVEADLVFVDPPWGTVSSGRSVSVADLPLLAALLPLSERFARVWLKLPASFDDRTLPGFEARAMFGAASGDQRRIKFLWLVRAGT